MGQTLLPSGKTVLDHAKETKMPMPLAVDEVRVGNIVIFYVDEFRNGHAQPFDGHVQDVRKEGVDVLYLSGHRSRHDFIPWADIIAKVDKRRRFVRLKLAMFSGRFEVYKRAEL